MPAFDQCHDQVVHALQKDGWNLDRTPLTLYFDDRYVYVDLRMSRGSNGQHEQIMLVEVKCFPDPNSTSRDLYVSIGQYLVYRAILAELREPYPIYLAVPKQIFEGVFDKAVMRVISENKIKIVVINLETEEIVQWIR